MNPPTIIMAGGSGSRMGPLGKSTPKFLLPVNGEVILARTIKMIISAKYSTRIIISTRAEYAEKIKQLLRDIGVADLNIEVLINEGHSKSVVDALMTIRQIKTDIKDFYLVLSDIFFITNPFMRLSANDSNKLTFFGSKSDDELELKRGGIVVTSKSGDILSIVKAPQDDIDFININSVFHYKLANVASLTVDDDLTAEIKNEAFSLQNKIRTHLLDHGYQI